MISANTNWNAKPWHTFEFKDLYAVVGKKDHVLDIVALSMEIAAVTSRTGGMHCSVTIAGLRPGGKKTKDKKAGPVVSIPDYNAIGEIVKVGEPISVVLITTDSNERRDRTTNICVGTISNVRWLEGRDNMALSVNINPQWDDLPTIPAGALSSVASSTGNKLLSQSRLLSNDKSVIQRTMRKLKMPTKGDCDIATAVATMIDNTETLFTKGDSPNVLRDALHLKGAPLLKARGNRNTNIMLYLARLYASEVMSSTKTELFVDIMSDFHLQLVPRVNKKGEWKPAVIPNNMWDEPSMRVPLYAILEKSYGSSKDKTNPVGAVAVQYRSRPNRGKDVELSGVAVCAELMEKGKKIVRLMEDVTVKELNKLRMKDKKSGKAATTGAIITKDLPEWLEFVRSPEDKEELPLKYKKKWAALLAKQEFSSVNRSDQTLHLKLQPSQFWRVLNAVGKIVEITNHNEDAVGKGWDAENDKKATYASVMNVDFKLEIAQDRFQANLSMLCHGMRTGYEQKTMAMSSSDVFKWKGEVEYK